MRTVSLAWLAALALSIGLPPYALWSAHASAQGSERIVFDATIVAIPPAASGPCMLLGNGRLTARARLTGDPAPRPVMLRLTGYQESVPAVGAALPVGSDEVSATLPLTNGPVCWTVEVWTPVDLSAADAAERSTYVQFVALTMTFAPD